MVTVNERDRSATEARLKAAAVAVWSHHGFDGASVKEIAEAAGANVSLINRYFGGKEGLLLTILDEMILRKQEGALDYPAQNSLEAETLEYLRFRYRADMADQARIRIIISKITVDRAFRDRALRSLTYATDANFMERLVRLRDAGRIAPGVALPMVFRQVAFISFSAALTEGIILERPADDTDRALRDAAGMIGAFYGRGGTRTSC